MTPHEIELAQALGRPISAQLAGIIAELMKADGRSRRIDLAISAAINFKGVFDPQFAWRWGAGGDEIEGWREGKRCAFLDPVQFVPRWTASLDAALELVPADWFYRVGRTSCFQAWAGVYKEHPDHTIDGETEFNFKREYWEKPDIEPVIALCIVALEARRVIAIGKVRP